jgi:murein DD-endopeptidase MepM/ murein hydrolase activator NlpD
MGFRNHGVTGPRDASVGGYGWSCRRISRRADGAIRALVLGLIVAATGSGVGAAELNAIQFASDAETAAARLRAQVEAIETGIRVRETFGGQLDPEPPRPVVPPLGFHGTAMRDDADDRLQRLREAVLAAVSPRRDAAPRAALHKTPSSAGLLMTPGAPHAAALEVTFGGRDQLAAVADGDQPEWRRDHRIRRWLQDGILARVGALEDLVDGTGVDLDQLIARAAWAQAPAQGGPLQVVDPDAVRAPAPPSGDDPMSWDIARLALLHRVTSDLPLAAPLDVFRITSGYGARRDPFAGTLAFHSGLDLAAPPLAEVRATAPGRVVFAGPAGPYGKLVEVAHGMGIVTRYGHLHAIDVAAGDRVGLHAPIGVIGSSGRSTSRHLHYEIRIDDRPLDPARFLDAGRSLAGLFAAASSGPGE